MRGNEEVHESRYAESDGCRRQARMREGWYVAVRESMLRYCDHKMIARANSAPKNSGERYALRPRAPLVFEFEPRALADGALADGAGDTTEDGAIGVLEAGRDEGVGPGCVVGTRGPPGLTLLGLTEGVAATPDVEPFPDDVPPLITN